MDRNQPWKWIQTKESGNPKVLGFSWPPRSYCCSFCGREFKSAQALGGHMNVHRRDRALLRNPCPSLSPNGNSSSSSSSLSCFNPLLKFRSPSFLSSSCQTSLSSPSEVKNISAFPASSLHHSSSKEIDFSISKTSIDLNTVVSQKPNNLTGVQELKDSKDGGFLSLFPSKNQNGREFGRSEILSRFGVDSQRDSAVDDLDLELRLGCKSR